MASVTFPVELGGDGKTYTDDANPTTGMGAGGHRLRFIPALSQAVAMTATAKQEAEASKSFKEDASALRDQASASAASAANSATAANSSKNAAATSASNASTSESNAANSATAANSSKNAAATSASNASTSESNAANSATAANSSKNAAATSASNASTSESNAANSATAANSSKNAAATSASNASASESNAANSATAANSSKNAAATSETNAANSASEANASKNAAATSAADAAASEANAADSAAAAAADAASTANSETLVTSLRDETVSAAQDAQQYAELLDDSATLDWNFATGKYARDNGERVETTNLGELATVTRPDTKQVVGPNGFQRTAIAGAVARQWNPVTGEAEGVVQEKASNNLLKFSEDYNIRSQASWVTGGAGVTVTKTDILTPDRKHKAYRVGKSGSYTFLMQHVSVVARQRYCLSVFAKKGTLDKISLLISHGAGNRGTNAARVVIDLAQETVTYSDGYDIGNIGLESKGDGWYRVWVSAALTALDTPVVAIYPGTYSFDETGFVYFYGAQLELGDKPTSYIPTPATFESRASTGTYFDSNGVLQTAAIDQPRENHVLVDGEWVSQGLLIEPEAATNLMRWSEAFDAASWYPIRITVVANAAVAPDGTLTADKLVEDSTVTSSHQMIQTVTSLSTAAGQQFTMSVYLKAAERSYALVVAGETSAFGVTLPAVFIDLSTGAVSVVQGLVNRAASTNAGDGWWRLDFTVETVGAGNVSADIRLSEDGIWENRNYTGDGTSGLYIWGAQLEEGTQPSSYIKTTDAPVTRAADVVSSVEVERAQDDLTAPLTGEYNPRQGTWVIDAEHNDGVPLSGIGLDGAYTSGKGKLVYSYDENGGEAFANGAKVFDTPPVKNAQTVGLGHQTTGRVQYFPKKLPVAQAIARATGSVAVDYPFADGRSFYTDFNANDYGVQNYQNAVETLRTNDPGEVLTVERNSPTWVLESDGVYRQVASNVLAREWNPETQQYQAQEYHTITNKLLWSNKLDAAGWGLVNAELTANAGASIFSGSNLGMYRLATTASGDFNGRVDVKVDIGNVGWVTGSFHVKADSTVCLLITLEIPGYGGVRAWYDLATGQITGSRGVSTTGWPYKTGICHIGNGVYRCWVSVKLLDVTNPLQLFAAPADGPESSYSTAGNSILVGAAQLVDGQTPGPVIPTDGVSVTRLGDGLYRFFDKEFFPLKGTAVIKFNRDLGLEVARGLVFSEDGHITRNSLFFSLRTGGEVTMETYTEGVSPGSSLAIGRQKSKVCVIGITWDSNGAYISVDGSDPKLHVSDISPKLNQLEIGGTDEANQGSKPNLQGGVISVVHKPFTLTPSELQSYVASMV